MPRYFFDCQDGVVDFHDETGVVCKDDEAARIEATLGIADLAKHYAPSFGPAQRLQMTVRTEDGRALLHLDLRLTITPLN